MGKGKPREKIVLKKKPLAKNWTVEGGNYTIPTIFLFLFSLILGRQQCLPKELMFAIFLSYLLKVTYRRSIRWLGGRTTLCGHLVVLGNIHSAISLV